MSEHPNATLVRTLMGHVAGGNLEEALACYTEDGVYRVAGDNLVSGNYQGRDAIRAFFYRLFEVTGGTMRLTLDDVVGDDGHAVMFWTLTAQREGKDLDAKGIMAFKVDDEGKFTESWFLYNDQRAYDEFYS
jgi:ketosteroid isomerase-like protein